MKKSKIMLIASFLTLLMLFSSLSVLTVHATYSSPATSIYYFNDFYPTITKSDMENEFTGMPVTYDHKWIDSQTFDAMVDNNYFSRVPYNSLVVIDIKTFIASYDSLYDLFWYLKNEKQCRIMFVSVYDLVDFGDDAFMQYVDSYFKSNFERLRTFIHNHIRDRIRNNTPINDTVIFIDGRLIDVDECYGYSLEEIALVSPFFRILVEEYANILGTNPDSTIYDVFVDNGITLIVHSGTEEYMDIYEWSTYFYGSVEELHENELDWSRVCAIGFSHLEDEFHDFLLEGQNYCRGESFGPLQVYLFEVEPLVYGENGLSVITDSILALLYGEEYNERLAFLSSLHGIFEGTA